MVNSLPDNNLKMFWGDIPDITYSSVTGTLAVTIKVTSNGGDLLLLSESYVPDLSGKVVLTEVRDIVRPYIEDRLKANTSDSGWMVFPDIHLVVIANDGTTYLDNDIKVYPSMGKVGISPDEFRYNYTQVRNKITHWSAYEKVNLNAKLRHEVGLAYRDGSRLRYKYREYDIQVAYDYRAVNISAFAMLSLLSLQDKGVKSAVFAMVESYDAAGKIVDRIKYEYSDELRRTGMVTFVHSNFFCLTESFTCFGQDAERIDSQSSFGYIQQTYRKYDSINELTHTVNTGFLSDERYKSLKELSASPIVLLAGKLAATEQVPAKVEEVCITEVASDRKKPTAELNTATVSFRIRDFASWNSPVIRGNVFDTSFSHPPFN